MGIFELLLLAAGLSMDAFAASVCKGLAYGKSVPLKNSFIAGAWFGGFQALMPLLGWLLGTGFEKYITEYDHWIAFGLLLFIGGKALWEAIFKKDENERGADMSAKTMLMLAIATSIDALAAGITFAMLEANILFAVSVIGIVTFAFSFAGVRIGGVMGEKFRKPAQIAGGVILILLGVKILLEHLGIIAF